MITDGHVKYFVYAQTLTNFPRKRLDVFEAMDCSNTQL